MNRICINDSNQEPKKVREIEIILEHVYKDVDSHTFKFVDASQVAGPQQANAIQSDSEEVLDGATIARFVDYRDSRLRMKLRSHLADDVTVYRVNNEINAEGTLLYRLALPFDFKDFTLKPLASLIHRYLVWGALYDWYKHIGSSEAKAYEDVDQIEDEIMGSIMSEGYAKRPAQPFGPAARFL